MAVLSRLAIEHLQANPELYAEMQQFRPLCRELEQFVSEKEVEKSSTSAVQISFSDSRSRPQVKNVL